MISPSRCYTDIDLNATNHSRSQGLLHSTESCGNGMYHYLIPPSQELLHLSSSDHHDDKTLTPSSVRLNEWILSELKRNESNAWSLTLSLLCPS